MKLLALIPLILAAAPVPQDPPPPLRPSGIAARINGHIITWDEVELEMRTVPLENRPAVRRQVLRRLAVEELYLQEAKNYNIEVTEAQIDADFEAERKRSTLTTEEFQKLININEGLSLTEFRANLRRQRTIATLMSRLATEPLRNPNPKLPLLLEFVSPEEMRDYYDANPNQFKAIKQIDLWYVSFQFQTPEEREEKLRLAESIRRRIQEGSPLFILALAYMDINLMPLREGKRMPAYANLSFDDSPFSAKVTEHLFTKMKKGDISEPIVDGNTVNVFHLQHLIDEKARTFEEAQPIIRRHLESGKRRQNERLLLNDLVRRSFVEPPDIFN